MKDRLGLPLAFIQQLEFQNINYLPAPSDNNISAMSQFETGIQQKAGLSSIFAYYYLPITLSKKHYALSFPQSLTQFPLAIIVLFTISNVLKLVVPFALQDLFLNIDMHHILIPIAKFVAIVALDYYFEVKAESVLSLYRLRVKSVLCERAIKTALRKPFEELEGKSIGQKSTWTKISANINIFVYNYYGSYLTLVFETLKAIFIVIYLFSNLGWVTLVGLSMGGLITQFIGFISKGIQNANFNKIRVTELKTKILTEYFSKIVDYQMSWLDGFIGDRIEKLEDEYQRSLRKAKLLDAWCVGLWQFTQIGISSVVLCLYYFYYQDDSSGSLMDQVQPATIIYLFKMLTFPMNAISWNIAGLNNAERAVRQLADSQRSGEVQSKREKAVERFDYGFEIGHVENALKPNKFYALTTEDPNLLRKVALSLAKQGKKIGYAQENGFFLPTVIESLFMLPSDHIDSSELKKSKQKIIKALQVAKCEEIPLQNRIETFSGGQKMRMSLARAFFNGDYVIIDSDLFSLDKNTRGKVLRNIKDYASKNGISVVMRGKKGDDDIDRSVHEFIKVTSQFIRVVVEENKNQKLILKKSTYEPEKQANEQYQVIEQKVQQQISRFESYQIFHPSYSESSRQSHASIPKELTRKLKLNLDTLKFYFHHKFYHFCFIVSLGAMYGVGNYYNYFVNVSKPDDPYSFGYTIMQLTLLYIVCIILRSYLFAEANLKESERICQLTNKLMIYNHISFYAKHNIIERNPEVENLREQSEEEETNSEEETEVKDKERESSKNTNTEKLVCLSTSDQSTINDQFPFSTNILWNNIATVLASLVMVFMEVPLMILFVVLFIAMIRKIEKQYRLFSERLVLEAKDQEVKLMKAVNNVEQGALYIHIYGRCQKFLQIFKDQLSESIETSNKETSLSAWVQQNFRFNMILFLILSVLLFWLNLSFFGDSSASGQSAKLSLMVRYILLLADYVFYLTRSLAGCRGKAISIERVKRFVENLSVIKGSFERLQRSNHKIQSYKKSLEENEINVSREFINLVNFNYQYDRKGPNVLENINLRIRSKDRIVLKGKTGAGKTTLFKILMGLYPEVYFPQASIHLISFSSQLPLKMAECSILEKIDPYRILELAGPLIRTRVMERARKIIEKQQKNGSISNEDEVVINNLRAYLYGYKGLAVYDQPQLILDENSTYIVVTHHGKFKSNYYFKLERGRISEFSEQEKQRQNI